MMSPPSNPGAMLEHHCSESQPEARVRGKADPSFRRRLVQLWAALESTKFQLPLTLRSFLQVNHWWSSGTVTF
ncbi:hypothetical protein PAXRUDRAFT_834884 [Paxillus rubicundulus Ve08.2h10]|uniref:Uncharacterized protein n=1 Tax=Paxillus rubicundulus Ve08.2h10 TaxID=930991 RepID=A0A0D0C3K7_9AGAM|nr:hypothetical protein PAXRUDRAFT_834884 [Paxillus rubicundulus Ve08.2h10]